MKKHSTVWDGRERGTFAPTSSGVYIYFLLWTAVERPYWPHYGDYSRGEAGETPISLHAESRSAGCTPRRDTGGLKILEIPARGAGGWLMPVGAAFRRRRRNTLEFPRYDLPWSKKGGVGCAVV